MIKILCVQSDKRHKDKAEEERKSQLCSMGMAPGRPVVLQSVKKGTEGFQTKEC